MRRGIAAAGVVIGLAAGAGPAQAATTVGQTVAPTAGCSPPCNLVQAASAAAPAYRIPSDGVITSWTRASTTAATNRLVVFRPTGVQNQYIVVGKSDPATLAPGQASAYPTRVAVEAGDLLGLRLASGSGMCCKSGVSGDSIFVSSDPADPQPGSTLAMTSFVINPVKLDLAAVLEPDNDHDGLGDETQDSDDDADGVSDSDEVARGTDPLRFDTDGDQVGDGVDNCPLASNSGQSDKDGDGLGDVCDPTPDPPVPDPPAVMFDRSMTIAYSAKKERFKGTIGSSESTCRPGKVKVMRERKGDDQKAGTVNAAPNGRWTLAKHADAGKYYATTAALPVTGGTCNPATSQTVKVG